jgi:SepF-like predicted cell division protein (DUF552 family)
MNFGKRFDPEVRCININPITWKYQCQEFENRLINKSTTVIFSIKDLVSNDPIVAMNFLQKIKNIIKMNPNHKMVALNKDMLLITPFRIHMAE